MFNSTVCTVSSKIISSEKINAAQCRAHFPFGSTFSMQTILASSLELEGGHTKFMLGGGHKNLLVFIVGLEGELQNFLLLKTSAF